MGQVYVRLKVGIYFLIFIFPSWLKIVLEEVHYQVHFGRVALEQMVAINPTGYHGIIDGV